MEGRLSWEQALGDGEELSLFFEVSLPTPPSYREHLASCLGGRVLIPHVLETAKSTEATGHALEGATKADAVLIAPKTGFAVRFEAKVLADASGSIRFDVLRNQIARSIDIMLESNPNLQEPLSRRRPERTFFVLITPEVFRDHPESRLYGCLVRDYRNNPAALQRDLPHRHHAGTDLASVPSRLGCPHGKTSTRCSPAHAGGSPLPKLPTPELAVANTSRNDHPGYHRDRVIPRLGHSRARSRSSVTEIGGTGACLADIA